MLVWNDPQSEYLDRFGDLTKSEASEDVVKVVSSIWNQYAGLRRAGLALVIFLVEDNGL